MLSLDDRTMNIYMQEQMQKAKQRFIAMAKGTDDSFLRDPLPAAMVHKALRTAQKKAEEMNLDARNNMLDFEAPKDKQRLAIYAMREDVLSGIMSSDDILEMGLDLIIDDIIAAAKTGKANTFDANKLPVLLSIVTSMPVSECDILGDADVQLVGADDIEMAEGATVEDRIDAMAGVFANEVKPHKIKEKNLRKQIMMFIKDRLVQVEAELARHGKSFDDVIREYMITNIDSEWGNHLTELDSLRRGIGLRGFAQRDPKSEFSIEAYASFEEFMYRLRKQAVCYMCHIRDTDERGTRYTMMGKLEDIEIRNYTVRREALLDEEFVKEAKFRY
jgi:preprotein translocase subunit SecA